MLSSIRSSFTRLISKQCFTGTKWSPEKTKYNMPDPANIINEEKINQAIIETQDFGNDPACVKAILQKALESAIQPASKSDFVLGLDLKESATLLNIPETNSNLLDALFDTAFKIKNKIYGNRIVLFAPLYVANYCVGSCIYCGYRGSNTEIKRSKLTDEQVKKEIEALEKVGHKRVLMLTGESPEYSFDQFLGALKAAASVKTGKSGEIRRINVEIPPLSVSDMKRLKSVGCVGTFTVFQETYHRESFKKFHPYGPKGDYDWRITCMDRANLGGIDDVGLGALFGLYDHRFEVLGLLQHSKYLDSVYKTGPHTISVPRIQFATGTPLSERPPHPVSDTNFLKLIATIRCSVPYTGMIISTRESAELRNKILTLGVSQISAGSSTEVGSYTKESDGKQGQFHLHDSRGIEEVVNYLMKNGYVPSWCTACYRLGRTGEQFMKFAKKGEIHNMCHPNALQTLAEYLIDYAKPSTQKFGWDFLTKELTSITDTKVRTLTEQRIQRIKQGERDLYF